MTAKNCNSSSGTTTTETGAEIIARMRRSRHKKQRHWIHLISRFYNGHSTMVKVSILLMSIFSVQGMSGFGYTDPDVIYTFEGNPIEVECGVNLTQAEGMDSRSLIFNETCTNNAWRVYNSTPEIEIIAADKIKLRIPKTGGSECNLTCQLKSYIVTYTHVFTGKPLAPVQNFKCRDYNWKNMTCKITEQDNKIPMTYDVSYVISNVPHRTQKCKTLQGNFKREVVCVVHDGDSWFENTDIYTFTVTSRFHDKTKLSHLASATAVFHVDHLAVLIPDVLESISVTDITTESATLKWSAPEQPYAADFNLELKSQFDADWYPVEVTSHNSKLSQWSLANLAYPYSEYSARIRIKTQRAPDTEEMWSPYAYVTFRTLGRTPFRAPSTPRGAFSIDNYGDVTIFWQQLNDSEHNGPNFGYTLADVVDDGRVNKTITLSSDRMSPMSAKYEKLAESDHEYVLTVFSRNDFGNSPVGAKIRVPRRSELLRFDINLIRSSEDGKYKLHWDFDSRYEHLIENFTVFSCYVKTHSTSMCDGQLKFITVPRQLRSLTYSEDRNTKFAISANSRTSTTGMIWAKCISHLPNEIGQPTPYIQSTDVNSTSLLVRWHVDCDDLTIIKFFQLSYCEIDLNLTYGDECKSETKVTNIYNTKAREYEMTGLKSFQNYKVSVQMVSIDDKTTGHPGQTYGRTLESAPSIPLNLRYTDVTSDSVSLAWDPPEQMNGILRHYVVYYVWNDHVRQHNHNEVEANDTTFVLSGLHGFTTYDIIILACTSECSKKSNNVSFTTEIGAPEAVTEVRSNIDGLISWSSPKRPGGYIDYYEIEINSHNPSMKRHFRVSGQYTRCQLKSLCSGDQHDRYTISVRAVNYRYSSGYFDDALENTTVKCEDGVAYDVAAMENIFFGTWTNSGSEQYCQKNFPWDKVIHLGIFFLMAIALTVLVYYGRRQYRSFKEIKVSFPPGLEVITQTPLPSHKTDSRQRLISSNETFAAGEVTPPSQVVKAGSSTSYDAVPFAMSQQKSVEPSENAYVEVPESESHQPLLKESDDKENYVPKIQAKQPQQNLLEPAPNNSYVHMDNLPPVVGQQQPFVVQNEPLKFQSDSGYRQLGKGITPSGYLKTTVLHPKENSFQELRIASQHIPPPPPTRYVPFLQVKASSSQDSPSRSCSNGISTTTSHNPQLALGVNR